MNVTDSDPLTALQMHVGEDGIPVGLERQRDFGHDRPVTMPTNHTQPNAISRLRYHQMFAPRIVERILKSAPPGSRLERRRNTGPAIPS